MVNLPLPLPSILIRTRTLRLLWHQRQLTGTLFPHADALVLAAPALAAITMQVIVVPLIVGGLLLPPGDPRTPQLWVNLFLLL